MNIMINTLKRITKMCERHEGDCGNCIFKEKKHIANKPEEYVCAIMESFEQALFRNGQDMLPPFAWNVDALKEGLGERRV